MNRLSAISTLMLFGRMAVRRQLNRASAWKMRGFGKKKSEDATVETRGATVHRSENKSLFRRVCGLWLPIMSVSGLLLMSMSTMFIIIEAVHLDDARTSKTLIVPVEDYDKIVKAAGISNGASRATELKQALESIYSGPATWVNDAAKQLAQERFDRDGIAAFEAASKDSPWNGSLATMSDAGRAATLRSIGLYLAVINLAAFGIAFGLMGKSLSSNDPALVWLWQFPVSRPVLFLARLTENIFDTPAVLILGIFYSFVLTMCGVPFFTGLAIGALLGLSATICVGAVRLALEVFLMQCLSRRARGVVVAVVTAIGSVGILILMVSGNSQTIVEHFTSLAISLPQWSYLNPFSAGIGASVMLSGVDTLWWLIPPATAAVVSIAAVALAVSLTASGLGVAQDSVRDSRRATASTAPSKLGLWSGAAWKELLQIRRQPEFLGQIMVAPISMVFLLYAGGYQRTIDFVNGSGANLCVAILVGAAYMLLVAANQMVAGELKSLWLLQCQPRPLADVIRSKARVWAVIAGVMSAPFIGYAFYRMPGDTLAILGALPYMFVSLWLLAELVFGFSVLAASVNNENVVRFRRTAMFVPMLVVADTALAMHSHNRWQQIAVLIMLVILNSAVRERQLVDLRWLSEPVEEPPKRVYAMHGLLAIVGFQTLTGGFAAAFAQQGILSSAAIRLGSYCLSAAIVSLFFFVWLHNNQLSIRNRGERGPLARPIAIGLAISCLVGFVTVLTLRYFEVNSALPGHMSGEIVRSSPYDKWFYLVLFTVAAPLFEEWLFRGVLFRSLRRGYGVALSVALSSILFATVHPATACIALVTLGAMTALTAERTGRLWPAMTVHAGYNLMVWAMCFAVA